MKQNKFMGFAILAFIGLVLLISLSNSLFLNIDPGEKGIIFRPFSGGLDKETIYDQGFHVIAPWNKMYIYDVRVNESFEKMDVLSKNGLSIAVELSYRFNPQPNELSLIHI